MAKQKWTTPEWLLVLMFGVWLFGYLLGAELNTMDARRHGLAVPHLWQPYR